MRRLLVALCMIASTAAHADVVRLKEIGRFQGWRDNPLVGYGIVTGLSGSGDSSRNEITRQALRNVLSRMGANLTPDQIQSRNVAAVMVTSTLPASAAVGDRIDVTVASIGDARSLAGGILLMTPLLGPDQRTYALAQGALIVGGHRFDADSNREQRNYPTAGVLPGGATVEAAVDAGIVDQAGEVTFLLKDPDFTTATRIADAINASLGQSLASVRTAEAIHIAWGNPDIHHLIARLEAIGVQPDIGARVVVNERSGTVVAGGDVRVSSVAIAQGDIRVSVTVERTASQPEVEGGFAPSASSLIVRNTKLKVSDNAADDATIRLPNTTVADLVQALARAHVNTRGMIAILQAIKAAGALHAEIIVQ